ncbi:hypothetical protein [Plantactinospora sp. KBS50]|uniref:aa3-type cytochrome oxidase subunit CtaJ n=1 Tax=Plantactinospora sp. KBS50 TaxID=2024580 RepID=UPI000BAAD4D7|nr:hypothetical protein [Plantactinospora sp. KBS50]ASW56316.1 hypothetical protein CIK06_22385 [Plantactinospora sp. KBS50]
MLTFVGIPALVVLVIAALVLAGRGRGGTVRRYRPGRPFDFTPVWFLSSPEQLAETAGVALPPGAQAPALTSNEVQHRPETAARTGATGGASDRW